MSEEDKEESGFVIKDRRHSQKSEEEIEEEKTNPSTETQSPPEEDLKDFPIDFSTFVLSLTSSAFYHLGDIADPQSGEKKVDLVAVKQTIDILIMLKGKTEGNLKNEEHKLLEQLTYELQMKYVAAKK